jgi:hypothetical protein
MRNLFYNEKLRSLCRCPNEESCQGLASYLDLGKRKQLGKFGAETCRKLIFISPKRRGENIICQFDVT